MNPGKVVDPYRVDENLRLGADYQPAAPCDALRSSRATAAASRTRRCAASASASAGATSGGDDVPELHGHARGEALDARPRAPALRDARRRGHARAAGASEAVKDALDLCLACKGCKGDCPVNVDMATYKAEFLSHYYEGRLRPRHAYAFGLIDRWARLASHAPGARELRHADAGLARLAKRRGGHAQRAAAPAVRADDASSSGSRDAAPASPATAARDPLARHVQQPLPPGDRRSPRSRCWRRAGFRVTMPARAALLRPAALRLRHARPRAALPRAQSLDALRDEIGAGMPLVGLEPSCVAVFRDELPNLFPNDEDAKRLAEQTFHLARVPRAARTTSRRGCSGKALVHGHCHHKAIVRLRAASASCSSRWALERRDARLRLLRHGRRVRLRGRRTTTSRCACGERVLLPGRARRRRRAR